MSWQCSLTQRAQKCVVAHNTSLHVLTPICQSGLEVDILVFQMQQFVYAKYVGPVSLQDKYTNLHIVDLLICHPIAVVNYA